MSIVKVDTSERRKELLTLLQLAQKKKKIPPACLHMSWHFFAQAFLSSMTFSNCIENSVNSYAHKLWISSEWAMSISRPTRVSFSISSALIFTPFDTERNQVGTGGTSSNCRTNVSRTASEEMHRPANGAGNIAIGPNN